MIRKPRQQRRGVILLIVISLLLLFCGIGLVFVLYAQAQATTARLFRETEDLRRPDADPEMLLSYFLGKFIYGDDGNGTLSGPPNNLADNLYGRSGLGVPFDANAGAVTYTYPDHHNMYLAAVKAGPLELLEPKSNQRTTFLGTDGAVLVPSYYRPAGGPPAMRAPGLKPMENKGGDVKNLAQSPGYLIPESLAGGQPQFASNDSIWIDAGFPLMTSADGRTYTALFAPLIIDLDNKINVNVHGHVMANNNREGKEGIQYRDGRTGSHQGLGPWEVNPERVLIQSDGGKQEARRIFIGGGNNGGDPPGRYTLNATGPWGHNKHTLNEGTNDLYTSRGPFYSPINGDGCSVLANEMPYTMRFPGHPGGAGFNANPIYNCFPVYSRAYEGWARGEYSSGSAVDSRLNHPLLYNFFTPKGGYYTNSGLPANVVAGAGQNYEAWELEALYRYGDTGSPALPSRLFRNLPANLGHISSTGVSTGGQARRMLTTHSFDFERPALLANVFPQGPPGGRINLNRDVPQGAMGQFGINKVFTSMSSLSSHYFNMHGSYPKIASLTVDNQRVNTGKFEDTNRRPPPPNGIYSSSNGEALFAKATQVRQQFAQELFDTLTAVTNPALKSALPGDPAFDQARRVAQLAVNIVDYIDVDDYMTPFCWYKDPDPTKSQWVYGNELPRVVLNEIYAEIANRPEDMEPLVRNARQHYEVRFWVELHNPLFRSDLWQYNSELDFTAQRRDIGNELPGGQPSQFHKDFRNANAPNPSYNPYNPGQLSETASARLRVVRRYPPRDNDPSSWDLERDPATGEAWSPYRILICRKTDPMLMGQDLLSMLADPANTTGDVDPMSRGLLVKNEVKEFDWDRSPMTKKKKGGPMNQDPRKPSLAVQTWPDAINLVEPMNGHPEYDSGDNRGYYVVGPPLDDNNWRNIGDPNARNVNATMRLKNGLMYTIPVDDPMFTDPQKPWQTMDEPQQAHVALLRRLCCPAMPHDPNPTLMGGVLNPQYNPYITVDYMESIKINDGINKLPQPATDERQPTPQYQRYSRGRNQPYAASHALPPPNPPSAPGDSNILDQKPYEPKPLNNAIQHTFFETNVQRLGADGKEVAGRLGFPCDWLCFADRPLISAAELMMVPGCRPHELTQKFVLPGVKLPGDGSPLPANVHRHLVNWYGTDPDLPLPLYRLFEYVSTTPAVQHTAVGGRVLGRININTLWDREIFHALADPQTHNFFHDHANAAPYAPVLPGLGITDKTFDKLVLSRSPKYSPGQGDNPFLALAGTESVEQSLFRADNIEPPVDPMQPLNEHRRLLTPDINPNVGKNRNHPYVKQELLRKILNNVTTRSNVFALWLTVGFFEVNSGAAAGSRQFGNEIGRAEGRHIRHRMFAIVDRSAMTMGTQVTPGAPPLKPVPVADPGRPPGHYRIGAYPVITPTLGPIFVPPNAAPTSKKVRIGKISEANEFEGLFSVSLRRNDYVLVEPGPNEEVVLLSNVNASGDEIEGIFTKSHPARVAVIKVHNGQSGGMPAGQPGHPGAQRNFSVRNPIYAPVVRHFSIIE